MNVIGNISFGLDQEAPALADWKTQVSDSLELATTVTHVNWGYPQLYIVPQEFPFGVQDLL